MGALFSCRRETHSCASGGTYICGPSTPVFHPMNLSVGPEGLYRNGQDRCLVELWAHSPWASRPIHLTWLVALAHPAAGPAPSSRPIRFSKVKWGFNTSVTILGPANAGTLIYTQSVFIAIFAWIIPGERLEWYHYVGAAIIATGVCLVLMMRPKPAAKAS